VSEPFRPCALVPAYGAEKTVGAVVRGLREHCPVLVVDDGSNDGTGEAARLAGAEVLRLSPNGGKGTALRAGLERLLAIAFVGGRAADQRSRLLEAARGGGRSSSARAWPSPTRFAYRYRTNEIGSGSSPPDRPRVED
jgi:glycosyltransferase involved in cell wall biosynthesis